MYPSAYELFIIFMMLIVNVLPWLLFVVAAVLAIRWFVRQERARKDAQTVAVRRSLGEALRAERERCRMTQEFVAQHVGVSRQAVSKWESGRGLPDISLVEPLAAALGVSVAELLTGDVRQNANRAGNLLRARFYVCPICGNVVYALGEGSFSCCGVQLLPCEAEPAEPGKLEVPAMELEPGSAGCHAISVERIEDEWYVTLDHPMRKDHFISFIAYVSTGGVTIQKLYPEQEAAARFRAGMSGVIYTYCNRHGLFSIRTPRRR